MRRYVILFLTALFALASILVAVTAARSSAETRVCQLWVAKPYRHCIRYAPSPTTTSTTTTVVTTTTVADTTPADTEPTTTSDPDMQVYIVCHENSQFRGKAYMDVLYYDAYWTDIYREIVNQDALTVIQYCPFYPGTDDLVRTARVVVDCFATHGHYIGACYQPPGNEVNYFAAALITSSR